jgi:predicted Zn-dependent peptidase
MRERFLLACLLGLTVSSASGFAQDDKGTSVSAVERKNLAPVNNDVLRVTLPRATEATLSNGLTVLILEDHRLPQVSITYNVTGAGALFEPQDMPGLASITAQMLEEGTKTRNSLQIAEQTEVLGASVSASAGYGSAVASVSASGLTDNFDAWFALANDILLNPSFPKDELDKLKVRLKTSLRQQRTSANFLSNERFSKAVYGNHPGGTVTTTAETIDKLTPEILAKWHRERFVPQNSILGLAGDVKPSEIVPKLEKLLGVWKKTDFKEVLPQNPKAVPTKKVLLVDRPGSVQTSIVIGNIAIDRKDPDYFPLYVANYVLGGGPTGRLFLNLREEKGYTYGAYSGLTALKYPGPWRASADVRTEVTEGAMTEFFNEINRMRNQRVPENELEETKHAIVASFALSLESPSQLLNYAITRKLYGFSDDYWDTYPAKILAITAADVQRMAQKYIDPANLQVVAVGDAGKIKPIMEKYGPVEVYDVEGKKLP